MRKIIASVLAVLMLIGLLAGCAFGTPEPDGDDGRLRIVTTVFPAYDWIRNILGSNPGNADVIWLLDGGVDLHSYPPSEADILAINEAYAPGGDHDELLTSLRTGYYQYLEEN